MKIKYAVILSILSGVLVGLTLPTRFGPVMMPDLGWMAWFALVPFFLVVQKVDLKRVFLFGLITGFFYHTVSLFWIYPALTEYGGLSPFISVIMLIVMMMLLGLYFSVIPLWARWASDRLRLPMIVLLSVAYVAVEFARNYFPFGGFPWNNIAYSQYAYLPVIQMTDLFGIYAVTFVLVFTNWYLSEIVKGVKRVPGTFLFKQNSIANIEKVPGTFSHTLRLSKLIVLLILLTFTFTYGYYKLATVDPRPDDAQKTRVALIQANIPQDEKWEDEYLQQNLQVYRDQMKLINNGGATLAIWPESAFPYMVPIERNNIPRGLLGLGAGKTSLWLLLGVVSVKDMEKEELYNSAFLVNPEGDVVGRYHKNHLVPFGEYVPLRDLFFFAQKLVSIVGDFVRGSGFTPLIVKDYAVGPLICYEDVFPEISREMTVNGANVLVTITNDAWYGWTSAAYQHLAISAFRAVENRRFMLRAANTGVSAVISPTGKIEIETQIFSKGLVTSNISVLDKLTIYDKIGDIFAYIAAVLVLLATAAVFGMRIICRKN